MSTKVSFADQAPTPISGSRRVPSIMSTPHVSKFGKSLSEDEDAQQRLLVDEVRRRVQVAQRFAQQDRKQAQSPYFAANSTALPSSARKFMEARSKKPARKSVVDALTDSTGPPKMGTPLKHELRQAGLALQERRSELLSEIASYDLDPNMYALWTVEELTQRAAALQEEEARAGAEALLVEFGYDPAGFVEFPTEDLESWLENEVMNKTSPVKFCGNKIEFPSPSPYRPSSNVDMDASSDSLDAATENENTLPQQIVAESAAKKTDLATFDIVSGMSSLGLEEENKASEVVTAAAPAAAPAKAVQMAMTTKLAEITKMTCDQIRAELRTRGLKATGVKSIIAERLAHALAHEQPHQEESWLTEGHEFIGKKVLRSFRSGKANGTIVSYVPELAGEPMLFKIVHEDGDEEHLEEDEAQAAINAAGESDAASA